MISLQAFVINGSKNRVARRFYIRLCACFGEFFMPVAMAFAMIFTVIRAMALAVMRSIAMMMMGQTRAFFMNASGVANTYQRGCSQERARDFKTFAHFILP
jgi:hypothetical protein